ncbi:MAG: hypothetical protein PHQ19_07160, partial [Candidatus Krumholzibacteria bacterium]|nr:hypothetical protein [Candidatus Krumholzibacteria bacterium]
MYKHLTLRSGKRLSLLLLVCVFFIALGQTRDASAFLRVSVGVDYNTGGYSLLTRYGDWVRIQPYGVVWCPYVDEGWAPFYDGRWVWTTGGWAWYSYEPFGDIVYHYGYWYFDRSIGWFWVPGYEWSPARVQWYTYGTYCGWAPMPPPNRYWPNPWDYDDINIWVVVHINNFCDDHIGRNGIDRPLLRDVFRREGAVKRAPERTRVERVVSRQVPVQTITKRPMDIRTDKFEADKRSATRGDVQARAAVPENRSRAARNGAGATLERTAIERRAAAPNAVEREVAKRVSPTPKQDLRSRRKTLNTATGGQNDRRDA